MTSQLTTQPDGKLSDFIDQKIRPDTPEEYVRQNIERRLVLDYGTRFIRRYSYGSAIRWIDRDMLGDVPIPLADEATRREVGELVRAANRLRHDAWWQERAAIQSLQEMVVNSQ